MDVSQYLEIFIDETKEHLQSLNEHLLILEKEPDNENTINEIFRAAHSLKGMAGTMGFKRMQRLTHDMENVFSEVRAGNMKVSSDLVDVLFRGLDALENYLASIVDSADEGTEDNEDIINALNNILKGGTSGGTEAGAKVSATEIATKVEEAATAANDKHKYKNIKLDEHEINAIKKAGEMGLNVVGLTVYIQENCVLKGARAFMVNRTLEEQGDIIKLDPSAQDLEDEKYDYDYSAFVITKETPEVLAKKAMDVSEVKEVVADYYQLSEADKKPSEAASSETKAQSIANKETNSLKAGKAPAAKPAAKPVVNRSVRVDIEKLDVLMNLVSELIIAKNGLISVSSETDIMLDGTFHEQIEYLEKSQPIFINP